MQKINSTYHFLSNRTSFQTEQKNKTFITICILFPETPMYSSNPNYITNATFHYFSINLTENEDRGLC